MKSVLNKIKNYFFLGVLKRKIICKLSRNSSTEYSEELKFLRNNPLSIYPYRLSKKYSANEIVIEIDSTNDFPYLLVDGFKVYLKRKWSIDQCKDYFNSILIEQDENSPHCYLRKGYEIDEGSIVYDIGCAEGIFAIRALNRAKLVYIFEPDTEWLECLKLTFKDQLNNKIIIIEKFVSNSDSQKEISLDTFTETNLKADFIKIDAEGFERDIIDGATSFLNKHIVKLIICTYHLHDDFEVISSKLSRLSFNQTFSGYMLNIYDPNFNYPYFRRNLIFANNHQN